LVSGTCDLTSIAKDGVIHGDRVLAGNVVRRGFVTNEHRYLVIGQAPV
jgi:hypothetical protein